MGEQMPLPLPVFPYPLPADRAQLILAALRRINSPIKVLPVEGGPGLSERILCFGALPPYLCRSIPISPANVDSPASIEAALRIWLDPFRDESRWNEEFQLGVWMGTEVRYSHTEDELGVVFNA